MELAEFAKDRFKIKYHTEDQPIKFYALIFQKKDARLKPADPNSRSTCKRAVANNSFVLRPRSHVKTRPLRSSRTNCPQWRPPMSIIPPSMHQDLKEDSTSRSPGRHAATSTVANGDRRLEEELEEELEEAQASEPELLPTPMAP
jgi:hypothetical protein